MGGGEGKEEKRERRRESREGGEVGRKKESPLPLSSFLLSPHGFLLSHHGKVC